MIFNLFIIKIDPHNRKWRHWFHNYIPTSDLYIQKFYSLKIIWSHSVELFVKNCNWKTWLNQFGPVPTMLYTTMSHRHLREIDCSLAVVGRLVTGAESGGKSIHWPCMWRLKMLHSGGCGWRHYYYSQQRQAGRANEQSTSLRCLCLEPI